MKLICNNVLSQIYVNGPCDVLNLFGSHIWDRIIMEVKLFVSISQTDRSKRQVGAASYLDSVGDNAASMLGCTAIVTVTSCDE